MPFKVQGDGGAVQCSGAAGKRGSEAFGSCSELF